MFGIKIPVFTRYSFGFATMYLVDAQPIPPKIVSAVTLNPVDKLPEV